MSDQETNVSASATTEQVEDNEPYIVIPLCYLCDNPEIVGKCIRCQRNFCIKDVNKIDSRYCAECLTDLTIEETKFTRTTTEYDEETDTCHTETRSCKDIVFRGTDWMFQSERIAAMSDEQVKTELEYHRYFVSFLENELVSRTVKKYRMKMQLDIDKKHAKYVKVTETKTKKVVKTAPTFDPVAFAKQLLAMGLGNLNINTNGK